MSNKNIQIECKNVFKDKIINKEEFTKRWVELINQLQKSA